MKEFYIFVGARPNFMKAAPLCKELEKRDIPYKLYHSGQHYDRNLSGIFMDQLDVKHVLPLGCIMSDNQVKNIQAICHSANKLFTEKKDEIKAVIVFGDVLTTLAVTMAANDHGLKTVHVEAGLRCFDLRVPEDLIRLSVDHMSDILFCPSMDAVENLIFEGKEHGVYMVGNIMIDTLCDNLDKIRNSNFKCSSQNYIVATFHRQENVDDLKVFAVIMDQLVEIADRFDLDVVFPGHPKTKKLLDESGFHHPRISIIDSLGYIEFMKLIMDAKAVVTDSGGIQEETTYLRIPCFTVRNNTERPITVKIGTNHLIKVNQISDIFDLPIKVGHTPEFWDGKTSERIVDILKRTLN